MHTWPAAKNNCNRLSLHGNVLCVKLPIKKTDDIQQLLVSCFLTYLKYFKKTFIYKKT